MHSFYRPIHSCYGDFHKFFRNSRNGCFLPAGRGRRSIFAVCYRQSILVMLLGLLKLCFSCCISKYHKQDRALREMRGEFSAKRVTSVHSISFSPFYVICFKMCNTTRWSLNIFYVTALKACVLKVPKVCCFCSCFVCGTFPFLN